MHTTRGIKNCRGSKLFKALALIKFKCTMIDKCFENGNFSYHQRYQGQNIYPSTLKIIKIAVF